MVEDKRVWDGVDGENTPKLAALPAMESQIGASLLRLKAEASSHSFLTFFT